MIVHHVGEAAPKELKLDVTLDAPRAAVWRCWTEPSLLKEWHCPKPWNVAEADIRLSPGGRMNIVMAGPDGERIDCKGAYLEVEPQKRLTFTDAYTEGFVPAEKHFMTGYVELADEPGGKTRMIWGARHSNDEDTKKHLEMGFVEGWKAAAAQLEELAGTVR
jgi:uncharacterized protein YndB with AHSA1/START domain